MSRNRLVFSGVFIGLLVSMLSVSILADSFQVTNPLIQKRADPYIYKHSDGYYYFTATVPEYDRIELRRATTIQGLASATTSVIWTRHSSGEMGSHIWAPELHFINNTWYIYFAAGRTDNVWAIRIYILENTSANPLQGTWVEKGQLQPAQNAFSLDSTTFEHNGTRYLVFAKQDSTVNNESCLFIASMSNPWTLSSTPVRITKPEYSWERAGIPVNEGPAVLKRNGKIFIAYSAAKTDANYCMGLLTASDTSNLLSPSSWSKSATPVFQSNAANSQYGPGHNSFTTSPDGSDDIMVYHARNYQNISGDPLNDPNRHTRVQQFTWNSNGVPNFGVPVTDGTITIGGGTTPAPTPTAVRTPTPVANPTPTPAGTANLALNKTASADSSQTGREANYGNDGNTTTRWCAANGNTGHWWKVDLGSSKNITRTEVMWEFARNYKYKIEVSTDNTNWTLKVDKTGSTSTVQTQTDNFTATARYVRITVTGLATSTWASFFEFRVY